MKNKSIFFCGLTLLLLFTMTSLAANAVPATNTQKAKAAKRKAGPKSDADIQTCITEKMGAASNMTGESITAIVADRATTLNGSATKAASKSAAAKIAKKCGASRVTNNVEVKATAMTPPAKQ